MELSEKIRTARRAANLSQEALGALLNRTQGTVSQWEAGITSPPWDAIVPLSHALGVTVDWLLSLDDSPLELVCASWIKKSGMQVINQLSAALTNERISLLQLQLLSALINEFASSAPTILTQEST